MKTKDLLKEVVKIGIAVSEIRLNFSSIIEQYNRNYAEEISPEARWKIVYLGVWMNQLLKQIGVHTVMMCP